MEQTIIILVIFGFAFFFQSLFGFGASFLAILGLSLFIPANSVIGMLAVTMIAATGFIVLRDLRSLRWKIILTTFLISLPGVILGGIILKNLDSNLIIIIVTILILIQSIYSFFVKSLIIPESLLYPLLLISGAIIGVTGLGIVYVPLVIQKIKKPMEIRVSLNFLWLLLAVVRTPIYFINGIITPPLFQKALISIPVVILFMLLGRTVHSLFNAETYSKTVTGLLGIITFSRLIIGIIQF